MAPNARPAPPTGPSAAPPAGPPTRPLHGLRVLDLTRILAGPVAGRTLAACGADVLSEPPGTHAPRWSGFDDAAGVARGAA